MPKWNATSRKLVHSDVVDSQRESKWQQASKCKCRYPESPVDLFLIQNVTEAAVPYSLWSLVGNGKW